MKVHVLSKMQFDAAMKQADVSDSTVESFKNTFFISINNTDGRSVPYLKDTYNVKVLYFDDVEKDMEIPIIGTDNKFTARAFTEQQAQELIEFIVSHKDKAKCFVHCSAGISRSGAVGEVVNDLYGGSYEDFLRDNPNILPNNLVKRLMMAAFRNIS